MGTLYHVEPVSEAEGPLEDWAFIAEDPGFDASQPSRNPTLAEVRAVLDDFDRCSVEYTLLPEGMDAGVSDRARRATLLHLEGSGQEHDPHRLWFEKGSEELIVEILERLSRVCGAFVLSPDSGEQPMVVYPGVDADEVLSGEEDEDES